MVDSPMEPPVRARYESRKTTTVWPFIVGAVLVAGVGSLLLTNQAYRPPYLETTTLQAVGRSALGIALRIIPLAAVAWAALWFGLLRKTAPRMAVLSAAAIGVATLAGAFAVIASAAMEKATYERDGREAMQALLQRTSDRYENEVLLSHRALNNRLWSLTTPGYYLWFDYREEPEAYFQRVQGQLDEARDVIVRHHQHIAEQQAEAIDRIRTARISRFGKAEAIQSLDQQFGAMDELRARHFTLANQILDEMEGQLDILQQNRPTGLNTGRFTGTGFSHAASQDAFAAHSARIGELSVEVNAVTEQLVAEGARVRRAALDRAVAERDAEQQAAAEAR